MQDQGLFPVVCTYRESSVHPARESTGQSLALENLGFQGFCLKTGVHALMLRVLIKPTAPFPLIIVSRFNLGREKQWPHGYQDHPTWLTQRITVVWAVCHLQSSLMSVCIKCQFIDYTFLMKTHNTHHRYDPHDCILPYFSVSSNFGFQ